MRLVSISDAYGVFTAHGRESSGVRLDAFGCI